MQARLRIGKFVQHVQVVRVGNGFAHRHGARAPGALDQAVLAQELVAFIGDFRATTQNFFGSALGDQLSTIGGLTYQLTYLNDLNLSTILRAVEKNSDIQLMQNNYSTGSRVSSRRPCFVTLKILAFVLRLRMQRSRLFGAAAAQGVSRIEGVHVHDERRGCRRLAQRIPNLQIEGTALGNRANDALVRSRFQT